MTLIADSAGSEESIAIPRGGARRRALAGGGEPAIPAGELSLASTGALYAIAKELGNETGEQLREIAEFSSPRLSQKKGVGRSAAIRQFTKRIVGGQVQDWKGYPSCVAVGSREGFFCTGVVVGMRTVLTAAHCAVDKDGQVTIPSRVFGGANRVLDSGGRTYRVRRGLVHPEYLQNLRTALPDADICALELIQDVAGGLSLSAVADEASVRSSRKAILVGYGNSNEAGTSGFGLLRSVESPILAPSPNSAQGKRLGDVLGFSPTSEFVGGMRGFKKDTCRGDSGGPAYVSAMTANGLEWQLAGLTSRATAEAESVCGDGGIYTLVSRFVPWLRSEGFIVGA